MTWPQNIFFSFKKISVSKITITSSDFFSLKPLVHFGWGFHPHHDHVTCCLRRPLNNQSPFYWPKNRPIQIGQFKWGYIRSLNYLIQFKLHEWSIFIYFIVTVGQKLFQNIWMALIDYRDAHNSAGYSARSSPFTFNKRSALSVAEPPVFRPRSISNSQSRSDPSSSSFSIVSKSSKFTSLTTLLT